MTTDVYQMVTDKVLTMMETHGLKWSKPWKSGQGSMPVSISTGKPYTGINPLLLWAEGHSDPRWGTYKAWQEKGGQVRKGEKATAVVFFKQIEVADKNKEDNKVKIPLLRYYSVFNASQVDGVEPMAATPKTENETIAAVDQFITDTGADIRTIAGSAAFYMPSFDYIQVPPLAEYFRKTAVSDYYGTLLHELVHWTGHKDRLARLQSGGFGSEDYAKEELVAELGSAFLCSELGIDSEPREDHAAYLQSWIKALQDDKRLIVKAASQASKACAFLHAETVAEVAEAA